MYRAFCSECQRVHEDDSGGYSMSPYEAKARAMANGWTYDSDKGFTCDECNERKRELENKAAQLEDISARLAFALEAVLEEFVNEHNGNSVSETARAILDEYKNGYPVDGDGDHFYTDDDDNGNEEQGE